LLLVEELGYALKRKAKIIAEITGCSESFDAYSIMSINPDGNAIKKMIGSALFQAGIRHKDIDYIKAHGTGTEVNDEIEASIIDDLFGKKPIHKYT